MSSDVLAGRTVFIPRMPTAHSRITAAAFNGFGLQAQVTPPSNERTTQLGLAHCAGDECYPEIITLGDFLRILVDEGRDPSTVAFFMPTSTGPCRFGQYSEYLRSVLKKLRFEDAIVVSTTSSNSYDGIGVGSAVLVRRVWRGFVAGDLLTRVLLKTRPYEATPGTADEAYESGVDRICRVLEDADRADSMTALIAGLEEAVGLLRVVRTRRESRPLIGVVGEIFCRNNVFSNMDLIRVLERHGAECWISSLSEWIHYVGSEEERDLVRLGTGLNIKRLKAKLKHRVQRSDQARIEARFMLETAGREEPHNIDEFTLPAERYLPRDGSLGEMMLSISRILYLWSHGADGVVDISPFTCMNAIVAEAIYPKISRDHAGFPIRTFYFDGTQGNLDRDVGVFMELARTYKKLQKKPNSVREETRASAGGN
jgi:predicted nucleotide-binding protein (sugar kinase/HSP70/actin superfamily)